MRARRREADQLCCRTCTNRRPGVGEAREAYDVVAGPSWDHRDDVEQLMGHQGVAYVTKILDTHEAILTESGRRESLKRAFHTQRVCCAATCGA